MNHKILFVDLDATLLSDDKTVSEENRAAIQKMLLAGHDIVLSTGRPVESGRAVARELELTQPGCYMIAFNGAVLYDCAADRVLLKRSLPIEVTQELFERAAKAANVLDLLEEEPQKVLMIDLKNTGRLARFREKNLEWEKGKCTSFFSCREYLEYCPLDTSKGTGVSCLTKMLNLPLDCTVAVGDEENDIAMLNAAHIGVAVKNATPEVKAAADYVTEHDNNHNAIAEVIERFIL